MMEYVTEINKCSNKLVTLINDILDLAKIESHQLKLEPEIFNINILMDELEAQYENNISEIHGGNVVFMHDDSGIINPCIIFIDPSRLRQALDNLISNAIKFTERGYVCIGYRLSAPNKLEFKVEDTGIGITAEHLEVVFEGFRQVELTNNRHYGGTGIGLTITRHLVRMMGGEISVESTVGAGSVFRFTVSYLPVADNDTHIFANRTDEINDTSAYRQALIVEPQIIKYLYLERLFTAAGYIVNRAKDIQQWRNFISHANRIDLEIVDVLALENASDTEIQQIYSLRAEIPILVFGEKQNLKYGHLFGNSANYTELEEPVCFDKLLMILYK
jgi:anti-sigma regulatory factor (Ser/Thr protein kinase)